MQCPYCFSKRIKVIDKRDKDKETIRRRRECLNCKKRFTTYEKIELKPLIVIKRDGRREPFNRDKLRIAIMKACGKRPVSQEKIEKMIDEIESKLRSMNKPEIKSRFIGEIVMEKLKYIDIVAYIRFASVYKKFKNLKSIEKELKRLKS
jgi:transcriptional repressor NrdR